MLYAVLFSARDRCSPEAYAAAPRLLERNAAQITAAGPLRTTANEPAGGQLWHWRLLQKRHFGPQLHHAAKFLSIPIGQAHTTVRKRLADKFRVCRPMDTIGFFGQIDPDRADRAIRARVAC